MTKIRAAKIALAQDLLRSPSRVMWAKRSDRRPSRLVPPDARAGNQFGKPRQQQAVRGERHLLQSFADARAMCPKQVTHPASDNGSPPAKRMRRTPRIMRRRVAGQCL